MANRAVHYEAAFEDFLRARSVPYVAVDEAKRALFSGTRLKSFDFVVYSARGHNLLVDVKGRSMRNRETRSGQETWATSIDVQDLQRWEGVFGDGFKGLLAFVYRVDPPMLHEAVNGPDGRAAPGLFDFRGQWYQALGIELNTYKAHMKQRSPRWGTVCLPAETFRQLARPVEDWL